MGGWKGGRKRGRRGRRNCQRIDSGGGGGGSVHTVFVGINGAPFTRCCFRPISLQTSPRLVRGRGLDILNKAATFSTATITATVTTTATANATVLITVSAIFTAAVTASTARAKPDRLEGIDNPKTISVGSRGEVRATTAATVGGAGDDPDAPDAVGESKRKRLLRVEVNVGVAERVSRAKPPFEGGGLSVKRVPSSFPSTPLPSPSVLEGRELQREGGSCKEREGGRDGGGGIGCGMGGRELQREGGKDGGGGIGCGMGREGGGKQNKIRKRL